MRVNNNGDLTANIDAWSNNWIGLLYTPFGESWSKQNEEIVRSVSSCCWDRYDFSTISQLRHFMVAPNIYGNFQSNKKQLCELHSSVYNVVCNSRDYYGHFRMANYRTEVEFSNEETEVLEVKNDENTRRRLGK